ncbi:hypothetical protein HCG80_15020 [Enterococcus casseliflavus]|uniref:hypothetical protein n=1 Tax=Enterococcus casseliflavus TaxID=37734 RepID=UPI001C8B79A6|nr:hypothetical protein [Enterococcus casseliflavus]MBX9127901.1 hypothetical protein [Enterococcus casseliflavus]
MKKKRGGTITISSIIDQHGLIFLCPRETINRKWGVSCDFYCFFGFCRNYRSWCLWSSSNNEAASAQSHGTNQNQKIKKPANLKQEDWSVFCLR